MKWRSFLDERRIGMNIFKIPKYIWWENMDILMQNVNLDEV